MADRRSRLTEDSRGRLEELSDEEIAEREARNGLLQFDEMQRMISTATSGGERFRLRPSTVMSLNRIAVDGLEPTAGTPRTGGMVIFGSQHTPPRAEDVPALLDEMCEFVNEKWQSSNALFLAAYTMWRLNWIHPFANGNGRTSRAVSYLVLCAKLGYSLPGTRTIPDLIAEDKDPYYVALDLADAAWRKDECDVSAMESLLKKQLATQLLGVVDKASDDATSP